jgi:hypothetical protein
MAAREPLRKASEDDPAKECVLGPSCDPDSVPLTWSRVWFEWRDDEGFRGFTGSNRRKPVTLGAARSLTVGAESSDGNPTAPGTPGPRERARH